MAEIESIRISSFRNLEEVKVKIESPFVCFYGQNAQGKTNILESLYLISNIRSFRSGNTTDWIMHGKKKALVSLEAKDEIGRFTMGYEVNKGFRDYFVDDKPINSIRGLIDRIRMIAYSPSSYELILGDDSERRSFFDKVVYSMDTKHLEDVVYYNKALKNRNAALKLSKDYRLWDDFIANAGERIISKRIKAIGLMQEYFKDTFGLFFGDSSNLSFVYKPSAGVTASDIKSKLSKENKGDEIRGATGYGPHRDKIFIMFDGRDAKSTVSTGQAKLIAFLFKIAKVRFIKEFSGKNPVFLYDDVSAFLDEKRLCQLVEIIKKENVQILSSSVDNNLFRTLFSDSVQFITVTEGRLENDK